jgi:hypothetical protein
MTEKRPRVGIAISANASTVTVTYDLDKRVKHR